MCSSVHFATRSLVSVDFPVKFYLLFLALGSTTPENTQILSGILNVYSKTKIKFFQAFIQKQQRELQNSVYQIGTQSCLQQSVKELAGVILEIEGSVRHRYKKALFPYKKL